VDTYEITPERTYNMDETGFMTGVITTSSKVIVEAVVKEPGARAQAAKATITQPGNREWVTTGCVVDPFIIIKGQLITRSFASNMRQALPVADFPYAAVTYSENGWSDASIAVLWLRGFIEQTAPPCDANGVMPYRLLIVNGHSSHASLEFIELAENNRVVVLCFPAHATHLLQPLDVVCFAQLKKKYSEVLMAERSRAVNRDDFIYLYAQAAEVLTPRLIESSFRATGIWPYDPSKVLTLPQVRTITPPPRRAPVTVDTAQPFTPSTGARLLRELADLLDQKEKQSQQQAKEIQLLKSEVSKLSAENTRKRSRQVPHSRAAVDKGKVLSVSMLKAIARDNERALEEQEAVRAVKQRRKDTVTKSTALIKDLKQRRAASKKEVTRLKKEYTRAKAALDKLHNEVSKPRSQARSQSMPAASTITAQQLRVKEHASQLEEQQEVNTKVHAKLQQIEGILVAIRAANYEDLSLQTALDHMDFLMKEPSDNVIIQELANDQLVGIAAAAAALPVLRNSDDELSSNTGSEESDKGLEEDNYSKNGLQYPPSSPSSDLWDDPHYPSSPLNRLGSEVPDSQDNEIIEII
jgi:hypothetical protein